MVDTDSESPRAVSNCCSGSAAQEEGREREGRREGEEEERKEGGRGGREGGREGGRSFVDSNFCPHVVSCFK